jgi:hypothetical protein
MSIFFSPNYIYSYQQLPFNEKIISSLSKQRIIQKNLVHLQGFPDSIYNENLLLSPEYLGQYGSIKKIALVSKEDKVTRKKVNSAYITFEKEIQAAYCILSLDSIKLNNQIVRAFFGTTKYCNHFLNNYICFNQEKCMFLHHFADPSDIIDEGTKFGYNEHINLAKKIIGYGSIQSRNYVSRNNYSRTKTILPTIKVIYDKEDCNLKKLYHRRISSNLSSNSTNNNSVNISNNRSLSKSSSKEKEKNNSNEGEITEKNLEENKIDFNNNNIHFDYYKSHEKSRFYNNNSECDSYNTYESQNLTYIVNNLCKRMAFFIYFKKNNLLQLLKELEINFCQDLYKKTNDNEIKLLLENKY